MVLTRLQVAVLEILGKAVYIAMQNLCQRNLCDP